MKYSIYILFISLTTLIQAQTVQDFEFDTINWNLPKNSQIVNFQGEQSLLIEKTSNDSLKGYYATVKKWNFKDGVIEFDIFCPQQDSSHIGFLFRLTNYNEEDRYELFYFNPSESDDTGAVQYMPVNNDVINWPDYDHNAYKSDGEIPWNEWIQIKANIKGPKATIMVNDNTVMTVFNLARGNTVGKVGLWIGNTPKCYFSNFKMTVDSIVSGITTEGQKIYASSVSYDGILAGYAFDKSMYTRWGSEYSDPQWIMIDLGEIQKVGGVILKWEAAYAKSYEIRTSQDSVNWTTVFSTTTGNGATDEIIFDQVDARYVMMYGTERATLYGYSLWEFEIYEEIEVVPPASLDDHFSDNNSILVYPNPASNTITIKTSLQVKSVEIIDVLGKLIRMHQIDQVENTIQLNINDLSKGIYFLKIQSESRLYSEKIIIK